MKNLLFLLSAIALLTYGCGPKDDDPQLNISLEQLDFTNGDSSKSFDITANTEWTVTSSQTWCAASPSSGSGEATVNVSLQANATSTERIAIIKVKDKSNKLEKIVTVTQAASKPSDPSTDPDGHSLNVDFTQLSFLSEAGSKTIQVTANVAWTVTSSDQAWCTVSPSAGSGNATVNVAATANTGSADRIAKLTVINSQYSLKKEIMVTQAGVEPSITISPTTKEIGADVTTFDIAVLANVEFDVTLENSWITKVQATATAVTLRAEANTTNESRTGKVTFKQKGGSVSASLTVTQACIEPSIVISPTTKEIGADAASFDVTVSANVEFDVTPEETWITKLQATATKVTLQVEANTGTNSRTGRVNFKQKGGSASAVLTVTQAGNTGGSTTNIVYVSSTLGNDDNDGRSWATAKKTINVAIDAASSGWQVWVDDATYQEQIILKEGVHVYGGFKRTEKNIAERNVRSVILRNIIMQASDFNTATIVDGFKITSATTAFYIRKNGIMNNCEIIDNIVVPSAIVLYVNGGTVSNSIIKDKISVGNDGKILNCHFQRDLSNKWIGSVFYGGTSGLDITGNNVRIEGCILTCTHLTGADTSPRDGIIINCNDQTSTVDIINCTVRVVNYMMQMAGNGINIKRGNVSVANCILLTPQGTNPITKSASIIGTGNFYITNTLSYTDYTSKGTGNRQLTSEASYSLNNDFSPKSNSPAVNAGDNSFVTVTTDILGNPRIKNSTVDIGAIESSY